MDISDRVRDLADRVSQQLPRIQTEEATKLALINPFIKEVLGYNTADLAEVVPEYTADIGIKKGEKVDYAIMRDGLPLILIEAKKAGASLQAEEPTQLYRYFAVTQSARFGIYTDGVRYLFYSDLDKSNLMDRLPFLVLDLLDVDSSATDEVAKFVKSEFDPDAIHTSANNLKYTRALKIALHSELDNPSEEFVKLLMGRVYTGSKTKARVEEFVAMAKTAARQLIRDELRGKLNSALASDDSPSSTDGEEVDDSVVTTPEELSGYYAVKAVLHDVVDPKRIFIRDAKTYCAILLDDTNRKAICRFWFNRKQKYISLFDEERRETRVAVDGVDDIYHHAAALKASARRYDKASGVPSAAC